MSDDTEMMAARALQRLYMRVIMTARLLARAHADGLITDEQFKCAKRKFRHFQLPEAVKQIDAMLQEFDIDA